MDNAQDTIRIEDVLSDEIMRTHLTTRCSKALLMQQLTDPTLMGLDLDAVSEMNMEELASSVLLAQDWVMNEQAELVAMMEFEQNQQDHQSQPQEICPEEAEDGEDLVQITFDQLAVVAYILLMEPKEGQAAPTEANIRNALLRKGVVRGIKEDYIDRLVQHPVYQRKLRIAQGKAPISGEDGKVTYHFRPVLDLTPAIDENGIADYKALNYIQSVKTGDLLCDISFATVGTPGFSVRDEMLTGIAGKPANLVCGANTTLSGDKTKLYASCDGQVFSKGSTVSVNRVLTLEQVNSATGNILFVGSVHVLGDIDSGFSVRAGGNIMIDGIAENAILVAGNNIVICGGIKGQGKALTVAGGSIRSFFIENARVEAKGDIYADVILNSQVVSDRSIKLYGKCGKLIGGACTAGETVEAVQIGGESNPATAITLRDPDTFGKIKAQNILTIAKYREAILNLTKGAEFAALSNMGLPGPEVMLCRAIVTKLRMERSIRELERQNAETSKQRNRKWQVDVQDEIFPNVMVTIDGILYKNTTSKSGCTIIKSSNKLIFQSIESRPRKEKD